ncbi:MAG: hypothetical protein AB7C89_00010 [Intestinibacillus sp.]
MKKTGRFCALLLMMLLLSGCVFQSGDDLLRAPQPSKNYVALQTELKSIMDSSGVVLAAPKSGSNRNAIQLIDLDNDGEDEAVSFFQDSKKVGQFTAYVHKKIGDKYIKTGQISGTGTAIESVDYPVVTPDGRRGIVIAWQIGGEGSTALTVCAFEGLKVYSVLEAQYTMYDLFDLDGDGASELVTFQLDAQDGRKVARVYRYKDGALPMVGETQMSPEARSLVRVTSGYAAGNLPAIFAEEKNESGIGLMTDIFTYDETNGFRNIAMENRGGAPISTFRPVSVYATDINSDRIIEIPRAVPTAGASAEEPDTQYFLDWYAYGGERPQMVRSTYYSQVEEWTFTIPEAWHNTVSVTRNTATNGMSVTTFEQYQPDGRSIPLLHIYYITSDIRNMLAEGEGMMPLRETETAVYTALIPQEATGNALALGQDEIKQRFSIISQSWGR